MSRVHYARQKHLLGMLRDHPTLELQLVLGGSALLEKYGERFVPAIMQDGFTVHEALYNVIDGGNHIAMAKTAGLTALEFANTLAKLDPDIVLIRGDRFEQLASAMVAVYLNKTVAHIEGGDVTGTIDESVRHAITKLAHIHFVTNEDARRRVVQMGENPEMVFHTGSLDVEFASFVPERADVDFINRTGVGAAIDPTKPYLMVIQHPVTTEEGNRKHIEETLKAVSALGVPAVWFWPNSDAGTAEMAKAIRIFREEGSGRAPIHFVTDVTPEDFIALLRSAACLVGNSSSGIKESSYFGVPVVNIGTRQSNRLRGPNVVDAGYDADNIQKAIEGQLTHGSYPKNDLYYRPDASKTIAHILATAPLSCQKKFFDA